MIKRHEVDNKGIVQAVDRALALLEALAGDSVELGLSELSELVGLHPSTTHRLLTTLIYRGYVQKDASNRKYRLGMKVLEISRRLDIVSTLRAAASDLIHQLANEVGETVNLVIADGLEGVIVDRAESQANLRYSASIGSRLELNCTGAGKMLLAYMRESEVEAYIRRGLKPSTPNTIVDRLQLLKELQQIRASGISIDNEEHEIGLRCVAVPIRDSLGGILGSISVSGPTSRMTPQRLAELGDLMKRVADAISNSLGYSADGYLLTDADVEES